MKIATAIKIVGAMMEWHFVHMGINEIGPDMSYTLEEMLEANRIVERQNNRSNAKPFVNGQRSRKVHITLDERAIASLYVLMNYEGGSASNASSVAQYQNRYLFVIEHNETLIINEET